MIGPAGYRKRDVALIAERSRSMGLARGESELESFLPLSDAAYLVLLAVAPRASDRGFVEALERTAGGRALPEGALLETLDRLVRLGLLEGVAGSQGERYRVSALGDAVLAAESGRRRRKFDPPVMPKLELLSRRRSLA